MSNYAYKTEMSKAYFLTQINCTVILWFSSPRQSCGIQIIAFLARCPLLKGIKERNCKIMARTQK